MLSLVADRVRFHTTLGVAAAVRGRLSVVVLVTMSVGSVSLSACWSSVPVIRLSLVAMASESEVGLPSELRWRREHTQLRVK